MFTEHPVIDFMPDQRELEDKGGTMRLGLYPARLAPGSKAAAVYGAEVIYERHRHRFEVNNRYRQALEGAGMLLSGQSPDGRLVEIVELKDHPWFVASPVPPGVQVAAGAAAPAVRRLRGRVARRPRRPRAGLRGARPSAAAPSAGRRPGWSRDPVLIAGTWARRRGRPHADRSPIPLQRVYRTRSRETVATAYAGRRTRPI